MSRIDEIRELTRVRVLSFLREPEAIFWVFVFPLVLAAVLGFAFRSGGVEPNTIALVDGPGADALADVFAADEHLEVERYATAEEAFGKLRKAAVDGVVEPGGAADLADPGDAADAGDPGEPVELVGPPRLTFDPVRAEAETARLRVQRALGLAQEGAIDAPLEIEHVTESGSRYIDFLFPGLIGMNLMGTGMWGIGFAIADVRRRKFLKRLLVTPMRKSSFFMAFILSRMVFLALELVAIAGIGAWVLGVPFAGNVLAFTIVATLGAMTFAGLGILVASRVRTIEGVSGLMNFVMMPMWLASGVFFSYERFPEVTHPFLRALPLTALNDALRAIMIDGEALVTQWSEIAVLIGWTAATFVVALKIFRWE